MMRNRILKQDGFVNNGLMVFGVLVLAIALPMAVFLTQKNQETRSKATNESASVGICGKSTGEYFSTKPAEGLCDGGVLIWTDEKADDGDWNWTCAADSPNVCTALKK